MMSYGGKFAGLLVSAACLSGCFGGGSDDEAYYDAPPPVRSASAAPSPLPEERGTNHVESQPGQVALQCVPYAREHSLIKIMGDANTWWDKASGKYERGANPAGGTVMVLFNYAASGSGHVAVVRRVVSSREIRVDHANWNNDGSIYVNDPVVDVSTANDWSQVKIWNIKTGGWGTKTFPVKGFIGAGSSAPRGDDEAAPPANDLMVSAAADDVVEAAPPVQRIAVAAPKPKPKPVRPAPARAPAAMIPVALTADDRDPAPDSGFALTDADRAIP